jgi:hypothetical protein
MEIVKKAWPDLYEKVASGEKTFDARLGDFAASVGDILVLREWDPKIREYTGRELRKTISFCLAVPYTGNELWSEADLRKYGLQIMALQ